MRTRRRAFHAASHQFLEVIGVCGALGLRQNAGRPKFRNKFYSIHHGIGGEARHGARKIRASSRQSQPKEGLTDRQPAQTITQRDRPSPSAAQPSEDQFLSKVVGPALRHCALWLAWGTEIALPFSTSLPRHCCITTASWRCADRCADNDPNERNREDDETDAQTKTHTRTVAAPSYSRIARSSR